MSRHEILALIPARSGSKSVVHKNIRLVGGKPLLAHSIEHARGSARITRTIVSTDSADYARIARQYGAEVPFLRPVEFAQDDSTDLQVFRHALMWLREHERYEPEVCVHLRPTFPVRAVKDIDACVDILLENPLVDSVRCVVPAPQTPYKMWLRDTDGLLRPVAPLDLHEPYNMPRQLLPPVFFQNACIDVLRARLVLAESSMSGRTIYGYQMSENFDIDTERELEQAARQLESSPVGPSLAEPKTFCFDIDGVIATLVPDNDYRRAAPRERVIRRINALHLAGHRIILFTARGSKTGLDWEGLTRQQLAAWGVQYHELHFGKPAADYYVDDRMLPVAWLEEVPATALSGCAPREG